jgi:hypothetical protein
MDSVKQGNLLSTVVLLFFITAAAVAIGFLWRSSCSLPSTETFQVAPPNQASSNTAAAMLSNPEGVMAETTVGGAESVEGFWAGPARGAGTPDCLRSSADAAKAYDLLSKKSAGSTEEGPDDLREMKLILSKIACFKRDLTGSAGVVEATRYQPFSTSHDLEPIAETTARCFAKTIPQRDLQLALDKWGSRGTFLVKRLCTSEQLTESEEKEVLEAFGRAMGDINDIALGACCNKVGAAKIAGENQPRMIGGYEPPTQLGLRDYNGYY